MKKRIAFFLAIAMIVTLLAGCGGGTSSTPSSAPASGEGSGSSAQPVGTDKLVIWSYMNEGEPISTWEQSIVDAYSAEYPDVEVEIVFCGREIASQFQTKLNDKEADDFPDIIIQNTGVLAPLAQEGLFEPLDEALTTPAYDQDKTWGETFIPNLMESMKINGVSYFIPESMYTHGFFYDAAMFRELGLEVPNTWDDLMDVCETLKENGIAPVTLDGTTDLYNEWWFIRFAERLTTMEKIHAAAKGDAAFADEPAFLKAAQYVATFSENGYFQDGAAGSVFPAAQALFTQGKAGLLFCGAWIPTEMASQTPPEMEMKMFALPELPDSVSPWHEEIWSNAAGITVDGKNKENAINFLKIFSSMGVQEGLTALKNPSPLVGGPATQELDQIENIVNNANSISGNYGDLQQYGDWFVNVLGPLSTQLINGAITPETFITQLDTDTAAFYQ